MCRQIPRTTKYANGLFLFHLPKLEVRATALRARTKHKANFEILANTNKSSTNDSWDKKWKTLLLTNR
jgi:hypothetical protein